MKKGGVSATKRGAFVFINHSLDSKSRMGCISSKIMTKSASFHQEFNRSMRKGSIDVDEIVIAKNNSDQLIALLCAANTVARKLKEPNATKDATAKDSESNDIETINTWEMLVGLEEDNNQSKTIMSNDSVGRSRSFRTVEDFDAMMAANRALECSEIPIKKDEYTKQGRNATSEKGSRRKAMAKELTALNVPGFEFARSGSLKDWLLQGGQVYSPGSYITPKFGNFISPGANTEDSAMVFDPEMIEQFEHAIEQLTKEEECILKEIVESLEDE